MNWLFLSIVFLSLLGDQIEGVPHVLNIIHVPESSPTGATIYVAQAAVNWTVVFEWTQPADNTAHYLFHLNNSTGVISVAQSLAGYGGHQYLISIDVYYWDREVAAWLTAVKVSVFVTKVIVCKPRAVNVTVSNDVSVGTRLASFHCAVADNTSVLLISSVVKGSVWRDHFYLQNTRNSSDSYLFLKSSLMTLHLSEDSPIELEILVTAVGASSQLNDTVQVHLTVTTENKVNPALVFCMNATVTITRAAELHQPLEQLCSFYTNVSSANVSGQILLDGGLPLEVSNGVARMRSNTTVVLGTYFLSLNVTVTLGNATSWSVSFLTIDVVPPHLHPERAEVFLNEETVPPSLVQMFEAINFPSGGVEFYLIDKKGPFSNIPFAVGLDIQKSERAGIYVNALLDYENPEQLTEYDITIVANSTSSMVTAQAHIHISLLNINDNTPRLVPEFITVPSNLPPQSDVTAIEWVDKDSNKSDITAVLQYTTIISSTPTRLQSNPFSIKQTPTRTIDITLSTNLKYGICCYSLHFILTDKGFEGMGRDLTLVDTQVVTAHWNTTECAQCSFQPTATDGLMPHTDTASTGSNDKVKYSLIAAAGGAVVLSLAVSITVFCWRQTTRKQEIRERIELNEILAMKMASIRSGLSRPPRLPTLWEEDEDPLVQERDQESNTNPLPVAVFPKLETFWEIPRRNVRIHELLGKGTYGKVYRGVVAQLRGHRGRTTVAVKMLKSHANEEERRYLMREVEVMKEIVGHPNVVRLYGASTTGHGPLMVITEYVPNGTLQELLKKSRSADCQHSPSDSNHLKASSILSPSELLTFALQIAKGMQHLALMKCVHGHLAARSILVGERNVMKISDFGLSCYDGHQTKHQLHSSTRSELSDAEQVTANWLAMESFYNNIYTTQSDVWSYGVVLWEIVTLGASPYPGVPIEQLFILLKTGYRLEKPDHCSDELYAIMRQCWHAEPLKRPLFSDLAHSIEELLSMSTDYLLIESLEPFAGAEGTYTNPLYEGDDTIDELFHEVDIQVSEML